MSEQNTPPERDARASLSEGVEEIESEGAKGIPWGWLMAGLGALIVVAVAAGVLWRARANTERGNRK